MRVSKLPLSPESREEIEKANVPLMHLLLSDCKLPPETLKKGRDALCSVISARAVRLTQPPSPIRTESKQLNDALDGGLPATRIIQLAGSSLSGKTHMALSFTASTLSQGNSVIWLETSTAASDLHERLTDPENEHCLSRLVIIPLTTLDHSVSVLKALKQDFISLQLLKPRENANEKVLAKPRLIVLDSLASLVAPVLGSRKGAWSGHVALNQLSALLRWLATHTAASVLVTNRVVRGPDQVKPALGNLLASYVDISMVCQRVERDDGADIRVSLTSKRGPDKEVFVTLCEGSIADTSNEDYQFREGTVI